MNKVRKKWFIPCDVIERHPYSSFQKDMRTLSLYSKNTMQYYLFFNCEPVSTHRAYTGLRGKVPNYFRNVIHPT